MVVHAAGKSVFEAWRTLSAKFDPQNDAADTRTVIRLIDTNYWKVSKVDQIPVTLAKWEALEQQHMRKTGETVLSAALEREIFLDVLPVAMRAQIEVSTMTMRREDITFDYLRDYVLARVFRHASAPKGHARDDPMQVDALNAEKAPGHEW